MKRKQAILMVVLAVAIMVYTFSLASSQKIISSRAYSGHETDEDTNNFVRVYPATVGTRLDDCQTCHRAGVEDTDTERVYNTCGYCHLLPFPDKKYTSGVPQNYEDTLNAYGQAYKNAGRTQAALRAIEQQDTDGDGYSNAEEIAEFRYPGDPSSKPEQPLAPISTLSWNDIANMPVHEQFLLMNTTRQQYDDYVLYTGIKIKDIFEATGIDLTGATGITVFAPDGFSKDFSLEEISSEFPRGIFYQIPEFSDPDQNFISYPSILPERLSDQGEIPDPLWLMIAYARDGKNLDFAYYQSKTGRLEGEGPYRLVVPQKAPSRPDRGSRSNTYDDGWDFDDTIDHNAGRCVRRMCVIRINPMPEGHEEYDWKNGWSLIEDKTIIIYGHGVSGH
jgi:hypothetical protein